MGAYEFGSVLSTVPNLSISFAGKQIDFVRGVSGQHVSTPMVHELDGLDPLEHQ